MSRPVTTGLYPFDPYGNNPDCLVENEKQVINPPGRDDFYFLIPQAAPFFVNSLSVHNDLTGEELIEGQHYVIGHYFVEAMNKTGRAIAGSIRFLDRTLQGIVRLRYQTVGGEWGYNDQAILEELSNKSVNPLVRAWAQIDVLPNSFPPIPHDQHVDDLIGWGEITEAMDRVAHALGETEEGAFNAHMAARDNPHQVTKSQVGLAAVANHPMASDNEALENRSDRYMSPRTTRLLINNLAISAVQAHLDDLDNPHAVTKEQVGLGNVGNFPIASDEEALDIRDDRYMSPRSTRVLVEAYANQTVGGHVDDRDNPHQVTAAQVNLGEVANHPMASPAEALEDRTDRYMSPQTTRLLINTMSGAAINDHVDDKENPHQVTAAQIGTLTTQEINVLLADKLVFEDTISNAERFNGMDLEALASAILDGATIGNAVRFDGRTFSEAATEILNGTAANADRLDGMSGADWIEQISSLVENSLTEVGAPMIATFPMAYVDQDNYVKLITREVVRDEFDVVIPSEGFTCLLTGEYLNGYGSALQLSLSPVGGEGVKARAIGGVDSELELFVTADTDHYSVWVKRPTSGGVLNILPLSQVDTRDTLLSSLADPATLEPGETSGQVSADITDLSPSTVVVENSHSEIVDALTEAFNTAIAELS
jgi:hypothetical protein